MSLCTLADIEDRSKANVQLCVLSKSSLIARVLYLSLSLSHWYPGSGVVLDCIDS